MLWVIVVAVRAVLVMAFLFGIALIGGLIALVYLIRILIWIGAALIWVVRWCFDRHDAPSSVTGSWR